MHALDISRILQPWSGSLFTGHMSFQTDTQFSIPGSDSAAVEVIDNYPGSPEWEIFNSPGFRLVGEGTNNKKLQWIKPYSLHGIAFYYGTFQMAGGGTDLVEFSLAVNDVQDSDLISIGISGNRPAFMGNTTPIELKQGDTLVPMVQNLDGGVLVQAYSCHISVIGSVQ